MDWQIERRMYSDLDYSKFDNADVSLLLLCNGLPKRSRILPIGDQKSLLPEADGKDYSLNSPSVEQNVNYIPVATPQEPVTSSAMEEVD